MRRGFEPRTCARAGCGVRFVPKRQPNQKYHSKRCARIVNGDWTEGHEGVGAELC